MVGPGRRRGGLPRSGSRPDALARVESLWAPTGDGLACLSVRSGLDLLLRTLDYSPGTEVLVSAITIRDIVRIIEHHGLTPVPVDIDMRTLTLNVDSLRRAAGPGSRVLLVAHLFGSRMPLDEVGRFARDRGLLLVEDCAQSFTGLEYRGHEAADVSLFSFGPLKTSSALGGALLRVKDAALLGRMKSLHATYPVQGRGRYLKRVLRFGAVRLVMQPLPYTTLCAACRALGRNHDELLNQAIRGFSGPAFFRNIRHQPSRALLALLWRRLTAPTSRVPRRIEAAQAFERVLPEIRGRAGTPATTPTGSSRSGRMRPMRSCRIWRTGLRLHARCLERLCGARSRVPPGTGSDASAGGHAAPVVRSGLPGGGARGSGAAWRGHPRIPGCGHCGRRGGMMRADSALSPATGPREKASRGANVIGNRILRGLDRLLRERRSSAQTPSSRPVGFPGLHPWKHRGN